MSSVNDLSKVTGDYFLKACIAQTFKKFKGDTIQTLENQTESCLQRMKAVYSLIGPELKATFEDEVSLGDPDAE